MGQSRERMRETLRDYDEERRNQLEEFSADLIQTYRSIGLGDVAECVGWMLGRGDAGKEQENAGSKEVDEHSQRGKDAV